MSATLTVTTALDEFDGGSAVNAAGPDGQLSLREAISAASSGDQITFAPSLSGSTIKLDPARGELFINKDLNIVGPGAANLAVSGQNLSRVFEIALGATDTISGLTIENGSSAQFGGGGVLNEGTLTVNGSTISHNSSYTGAGVYNSGGMLTLSGTFISGNTGGGIDNENGGTATVANSSIISGNTGRGIENFATLTLSASTVSDNTGYRGAGLYSYGSTTVCNGSAITDNSAGLEGGGIQVAYGLLTISNSTISGNSAAQNGGGIAIEPNGTVTISNASTISGNSAGNNGGGLYLASGGLYQTATLTVDGSTVSGNNAGYAGGGIFNAGLAGIVTVSDSSTITANSAGVFGGGIYNSFGYPGSALNVADSTVCGNSAPSGADLSNYGMATLTNSDICIINQTITTTTVASSVSPSVFGQAVTFTAMVNFNAPVPGTPTGTVTFLLDGGTTIGVGTLDGNGQATITASGLSVGTHTITALYSGDANSLVSTSAAVTQTVLSAQQELSAIVNQVTTLVTTGVLSSQNGNALIVKINNAIVSLNSGNTITGVNQLDAFLNQTNAFLKSGKLDSIDALTLITDIDLAIAAALAKPI